MRIRRLLGSAPWVALLVAAVAGCTASTAPPISAPPPPSTTTVAPAPPFTALSEGMSGGEIATVQQTLQRLGYQARRVDGQFDSETKHAVVAFQKVQGLPRTGVVDKATDEALRDPVRPMPRSTAPGFRIEVDIAKQVTYLIQDGVINRIVDASTGRGDPDAVTPVGDFHVYYQINGWRHARRGPMWRPSYITTTGIALHGGEPVESYPASNGCVRMTDPTIDEIFPLLKPGTAVSIY